MARTAGAIDFGISPRSLAGSDRCRMSATAADPLEGTYRSPDSDTELDDSAHVNDEIEAFEARLRGEVPKPKHQRAPPRNAGPHAQVRAAGAQLPALHLSALLPTHPSGGFHRHLGLSKSSLWLA